MVKSSLALAFLILWVFGLSAQNYRANHWSFGLFNGLDFSSGTAVTVTDSLTGAGGASAICDDNGDLVFYSNGNAVWQANGAFMQNGTGLVGASATTQTSLIVPSVTSTTRYYLFVLDSDANSDGLQYYTIEMILNGGLGSVLGPDTLMSPATEKLAGTKHGNDKDYWVVAHRWNSDDFGAYLVDANGVNSTPVISSTGIEHLNSAGAGEEDGQMKFSPDGTKLVTCNFSSGYVQLFDFDNSTGTVSNPINIYGPSATFFPYGVAFSADSKKLFVSRKDNTPTLAKVFQFDLDHASEECLLASETIIADTGTYPFKQPGDLQLGIDKKIYSASYDGGTGQNTSLNVIHTPHKMGSEANFEENAQSMNFGFNLGLTNFVSSFLSDGIRLEFGSNCDGDTTWFFPEDTLGVDSVNWVFGDPTSGSNTSSSLQGGHVYTAPDTFVVTLYSYRGTDIDTFQRDVIIWDTAVNLLGNDTTVCNGQPITLDASWYNSCYVWNDTTTNATLTTTSAGWHWVDVYHQSCVFRDSVFVTLVSGPPDFDLGNDTSVCASVSFVIDPDLQNAFYTWHDGSHDTTYAVDTTGAYILSASNACGTTTDTLNVILNLAAQPVLSFPDDTTVCDSIELILDVTFEDAVYEWSDGLTTAIRTIDTAGVYWVRVGNVCDTVSDTIDIRFDSPLISRLPASQVLCHNTDTVILRPTTPSVSVTWQNGVSSDTFLVSNIGQFWYTGQNTCGEMTDSVQIIQWDSTYDIDIGSDTTVCSLEDSVLYGLVENPYMFDLIWSNTTVRAPTQLLTEGSYSVQAVNRCTTTTKAFVIDLAPTLGIEEPSSKNVCEGDAVTLVPNTDFYDRITWSTGDTSLSTIVYDSGLVQLELVDTHGCMHEDVIRMAANCAGLVTIPNVISLNGDGLNDALCIETKNIVSYELRLFNRWGTEVFHSTNPSFCWDGDIAGKRADQGTYYYVLETKDATNKEASYRGSFTVLY